MIKILIADDQELIRQSLKMMLSGVEDFEVTDTVSNGTDVIRSVRENRPDVILMDVRMPVMDGLTATQMIRGMDRADAKTVPIIAMTANVFDEDVERSLKAGMDAHLSKPIEPEKMYETMAQLISKRSMAELES